MNYEQEEEYLTNDLSRKLHQVSEKLHIGKESLGKIAVYFEQAFV